MPGLPRRVELIRVSGRGQAKRDTPQDQRTALDALRRSHPCLVVERIEEGAAGLSGALPLEQRPDIMRLAELAKARAFDQVAVRRIDRLTRHDDPRVYFAIYGIAMDAGAVFIDGSGHVIDPQSEMGVLDFAWNASSAARDRKTLLANMRAGRERGAAQGRWQGGRRPYGRRWDASAEKWVLVPAEARVYRRLFRSVIAGTSLSQLGRDLAAAGIPTPSGRGQWNDKTIAYLLRARHALGETRTAGLPHEVPSIVDPDTFARADAAIRAAPQMGRPPKDPASALVRGVVVCGSCGSTAWVLPAAAEDRRYSYYVCRHRRSARTPECRIYHPVPLVDAAAREAIIRWLEEEGSPVDAQAVDPTEAIKAAEEELARLDVEEKRLLQVARKATNTAAVEEIMAGLASERAEATRRLENARALKVVPADAVIDPKLRVAMLRAARGATGADLRALMLRALGPGSFELHPGGRLVLAPTPPRPGGTRG